MQPSKNTRSIRSVLAAFVAVTLTIFGIGAGGATLAAADSGAQLTVSQESAVAGEDLTLEVQGSGFLADWQNLEQPIQALVVGVAPAGQVDTAAGEPGGDLLAQTEISTADLSAAGGEFTHTFKLSGASLVAGEYVVSAYVPGGLAQVGAVSELISVTEPEVEAPVEAPVEDAAEEPAESANHVADSTEAAVKVEDAATTSGEAETNEPVAAANSATAGRANTGSTLAATGDSLTWGFVSGWNNYVKGFAAGTISLTDGATQAGERFVFPIADASEFDASSGLGVIKYSGQVRYESSLHGFDIVLQNPWVEVSTDAVELSAEASEEAAPGTTAVSRVVVAELDTTADAAEVSGAETQTYAWQGVATTISETIQPSDFQRYAGQAGTVADFSVSVTPEVEQPVWTPELAVFEADGVTPIGDTELVAGDTIVVKGSGFDPEANIPGTTGGAPIPGHLPQGVFVTFGSFADVWQPSEGVDSQTRTANRSESKWALPAWVLDELSDPMQAAVLPQWVELTEDGEFEVELTLSDVTQAPASHNYGVYTYAAGANTPPNPSQELSVMLNYTPETEAVDPETVEGAGELHWGFIDGWNNYVTGMAQGQITTTHGASTHEDTFAFELAAGSDYDHETGLGTIKYQGKVRYVSELHGFDIVLQDPWITFSTDGATISALLSDTSELGVNPLTRVDVAALDIPAGQPAALTGQILTFQALAAEPATQTLRWTNIENTILDTIQPEELSRYVDKAGSPATFTFEVEAADDDPGTPGECGANDLQWAFVDTWNTYVLGIAGGTITDADANAVAPADIGYSYVSDDVVDAVGTITYSGLIRWASQLHGFDIAIKDPRVELDGNSGKIVGEISASDTAGVADMVETTLATFNVPAGQPTGSEETGFVWTNLDTVIADQLPAASLDRYASKPGAQASFAVCGAEEAVVDPIETTTTLSVNPAKGLTQGDNLTLTAKVGPAGASGSVDFYTGNTKLNDTPVALRDGVATFKVTNLTAGSHSFQARYTSANADIWLDSASSKVSVSVAKPAPVTPTEITCGPSSSLNWGVKESFREYLVAPFAGGDFELNGKSVGNPASGYFSWTNGSGSINTNDWTGTISYEGSLRMYGHATDDESGYHLDVTFADPVVTVLNKNSATLTYTVTSAGSTSAVVVGNIDLSRAKITETAKGIQISNAPVTLTKAGAATLADTTGKVGQLYHAGEVMDTLSIGCGVQATDAGTPSTPGGGGGGEGSTPPPAVDTTPEDTGEQCVARAVTGGSLTWGVRDSFVRYITGPVANGSVTGSAPWTFGASGGAYNPESHMGKANYGGSVRFSGHGGELDVTISGLTVQIHNSRSATLYANVNGSSVGIASLNLAAAGNNSSANTVSYSGVPATLTQAGTSVFSYQGSPFYSAGESLAPVSFTMTLGGEVPCDASTGAGGGLAATGHDASVLTLTVLVLVMAGATTLLARRKQLGVRGR